MTTNTDRTPIRIIRRTFPLDPIGLAALSLFALFGAIAVALALTSR